MALYTQGEQKIRVIVMKGSETTVINQITQPTDLGGGGSAGGVSSNKDNSIWSSIFGSNHKTRQQRVIITNTTHALAVGKQVAGMGVEYWYSGLGYKTGDQAYQENVNRTVEIVEDAGNIASSISMGAVYGAWGGPIGAVLGATMGAVSSISSTAFKYANRDRDFNVKVFKENNSIEYQRARANISLTNGRLR